MNKKRKNRKKNRFEKLQDTWHDEYEINAIGIPSQIDDFIKKCNEEHIRHSKPQYFRAKSRKMKIVFFNKKSRYKINKILEYNKYDKIAINANIVTARNEL